MNQDSTNTQIAKDSVQHSKPIPISTQHLRHRSASFSSESSISPTSPPALVTPNLPTTRFPPSSSSPILYFLSQSPSKASTFPFRGFAPPPLLEDELAEEGTLSAHARRASTNTAGRFQVQPTLAEPHYERGVNALRRLSLGGNIGKPLAIDITQPDNPQPPPNSAVSSPPMPNNILSNRKPRRSATITGQTRPHRAPSPMGERILKGHFDGFN